MGHYSNVCRMETASAERSRPSNSVALPQRLDANSITWQ